MTHKMHQPVVKIAMSLGLLALAGLAILGPGPWAAWKMALAIMLFGAAAAIWLWPAWNPELRSSRAEGDDDGLGEDGARRMAQWAQEAQQDSQPISESPDEGRPSELPRQEMLWQAVEENDIDGVRSALVSGALVNDVDDNGASVLARAVTLKQSGIVKVLLEGGADPHLGQPLPLHVAMNQRHLGLFWLLLGGGADPTRRDEQGQDAWHPAMEAADAEPLMLVSLLRMFPDQSTRLQQLSPAQQAAVQDLWDAWLSFRRRRRLER